MRSGEELFIKFLPGTPDNFLPGSLLYARDFALVSEFTEADTADTVLAEISVGATADLAAGVFTGGILLRLLLL